MKPEAFTRSLSTITNNKMSMPPHFVFNDPAARVFPLSTRLDTLQHVCNDDLNPVRPEGGYFRADMARAHGVELTQSAGADVDRLLPFSPCWDADWHGVEIDFSNPTSPLLSGNLAGLLPLLRRSGGEPGVNQ